MHNKQKWKNWVKVLVVSLLFSVLSMGVLDTEAGIVQAAEDEIIETAAVSVDDLMYERMFSVKSTKTGKFIAGGAAAGSAAAEDVLLLRYGEEGSDLSDNVPVAMYLNETKAYLSMSITARAKDAAAVNGTLTRDGAEQFVLKKATGWSEANLAYHIYHPQSGLYLSVDNDNKLYAYGKAEPADAFIFTRTGYSDVGLLTTLDGYKTVLTDAQKKRVLDVFGGVGARSLFREGGLDTERTVEDALHESAVKIYTEKDTTTAQEQADAMLEAMNFSVYHGQTNFYELPDIPGAAGVRTELSEGEEGTYDFWMGEMMSGKKYTFSVIDDYGVHTMEIYIQNNGVAQSCAANLMEAIKQTPFPIRRNIRTIRVREDSANSYNCGMTDLYMRLTWAPPVNDIAQYITHEFGHSMDFSYNVNGSGSWDQAIAEDIVKVSDYGSNNGYEDFAEFGRLYFQMYGNYNAMYALRQLYPNRYRLYADALRSAQYEDIYEKQLYLPETEKEELYDGVLAKFTFDDTVEGLRSGTAVARPTGQVVLDDNGKSGKVLKLDGSGSNFLNVWKRDNSNLLAGYEEFTISYYSKPEKDAGEWSVFLAPDANAQNYLNERYIGVLDKTDSISTERYNNYGERSAAITASGLTNTGWRHVVLVVEKDQTTLYVDGKKQQTVLSTDEVTDILGKHSVFQIGKGNWNDGEYYQGLLDEFTVYGRALTEQEVQKEGQKNIIAQLSFDNADAGFKGAGTAAKGNGAYTFSDDKISGKSLYLNGNGFVNITKENGTPLLTGYDEMTISYYSKVESDGANWIMFLAPNANAQTANRETYVGMLDRKSSMTIERYKNNGVRPSNVTANINSNGEWKHVIAVFENGMTTLYIDGEQAGYAKSEHALSEITGANSVLQVGKGNWGSGEYFKGYIDEMTIWDGALSKAEIEEFLKQQDDSEQTLRIELTAPEKKEYFAGQELDTKGLKVIAVSAGGRQDVTSEAKISGFDKNKTGTQTVTVTYGKLSASFEVTVHAVADAPEELARFTFDDDVNGFTNGYGVATGSYTLQDHDGGKALYLDGTSNFLEVKTKDGGSLLTGVKEMTVSYQIKPENSKTNWGFFAAPNANKQEYQQEHYLGIADISGTTRAERYNGGVRPAVANTQTGYDGWYYVTVVYTENATTLYINGEKAAEEASTYALTDILGENSILYIGKSTWENGEYATALIDNYKIVSKALTAEEVKAEAEKYAESEPVKADKTALKKAIDTKVDAEDTYTAESFKAYKDAFAAANTVYNKEDAAQAEVDTAAKALTDAVKALKKKPVAVEVDKTALQETIQNAVSSDQKDKYTEESWKAYEDVLAKAKEADADQDATQAEVDAAAKALADAQKALKEKPKRPFVDVDMETGNWYYDAVYYNFDRGIMNGVNETHFEPLSNLARAQFAIILHNMEGKPTVSYEPKFKDVVEGEWYTNAILWASSKKIVTGYTDGSERFGWGDNILREQMAVMMYRYAKNFKKYDVSDSADFDKFTDAAQVNDYAKEAMKWAVGTGIITGKDNGTRLDPQGNASRAECAIIIQRFLEKYEK